MNVPVDDLIQEIDKELKLGLTSNVIRTDFARGLDPEMLETQSGVDKNKQTIFGVAVATEGPAIGHGINLDGTFLEQLVEKGNGLKQGVKARFDHPNASSTSMGTAIGRFKQFRKAGNVVRADLHLLDSARKSPRGDLPEYLMDLAIEDPQAFGTSVVFSGEPETLLDAEGEPMKDEQGKPLKKVARLEKLYAADVVDEPAANPNGLFHSLTQESLASKITSFLDRYFSQHGIHLEPTLPKESDMAPETKTQDPKFTSPDPKEGEDIANTIMQATKARVRTIFRYGRKLGFDEDALDAYADSDESLDIILMNLIDEAEAKQFFNQKTMLKVIEQDPNPSAGGPQDRGEEVPTKKAPVNFEEQCKEEFANSEALQNEFMEFDIYWAFKQNEARTKTLRGADEHA